MDSRILKVVIKGDSMWPTYNDGDIIECQPVEDCEINLSSVVIFEHPFKTNTTCVKRVKKFDGDRIFVEGDNPDPLASEDSHNFGWLNINQIIAIQK